MSKCDENIGVFDSGVGGLSVLKEIQRRLPCENLIYIADSRHVPYGNKTADFIIQRCRTMARFLLDRQQCKALVIACNTATVGAVQILRNELPGVPILGMEPAVKPAVAATRNGVIGVLATVGTLKSAQFAALLDKFAQSVTVVVQPAPGLVECVEEGNLDSPHTRALVASFVNPLLEKGVDVIVLGCTHYPFLAPIIRNLAGPGVTLIETGPAVAKHLENRLSEMSLLRTPNSPGTQSFYSSLEVPEPSRAWAVLWPGHAPVQTLPPEVANGVTSI